MEKEKVESVVEKGKRILAEHARRKREIAEVFDIDKFVHLTDEVLEVEVPKLGIKVRYKRLTNADIFVISKIKDPNMRGLEVLYRMLSKADPKVTKEKLMKLDPIITTEILKAIMQKTPPFLT